MMNDLIILFEQVGAKQTNRNLYIDFNFNKNNINLKFDIENFKEWIEKWSRIKQKINLNLWDSDLLWSLTKYFRYNENHIYNETIRKWLIAYNEYKEWPDIELPIPISGFDELDNILRKVWNVLITVINESAKYGKSRNNLKELEANNRNKYDNNENRFEEYDINKWPPQLLCRLDLDYWAGSMVKNIYKTVEYVPFKIEANTFENFILTKIINPDDYSYISNAYNKDENFYYLNNNYINNEDREKKLQRILISIGYVSSEIKNVVKNLNEIFSKVPTVQYEGETIGKILDDILKLPFWEKRHELYSVWIFSQIINSIDYLDYRIHVVNDSIKFSFSGSHLATIDIFLPKLHIWSELRFPLLNPRSNKRKKAIQPDYSIISDPITSPESAVIIVECKQYLKASTKNFSNALSDYANGCPNAHVILVNYSYVNSTILDKVDKDVVNRTTLIGNMLPASESIEIFKEKIQEIINSKYSYKKKKRINKLGIPAKVSLTWESTPKDLDLYVYFYDSDKQFEINYNNKGNVNNYPYLALDKDVQQGFGPENIDVIKWIGGIYYFAVHCYSNYSTIAGSKAKIAFEIAGERIVFICPEYGRGKWWSVFSFNSKTGNIEEFNQITEFPLVEKIIFEDNFNDNKNEWEETEKTHELKVKNGTYYFHHKRDNGEWLTWHTIRINENKNFQIESNITKVSRMHNSYYALLWGTDNGLDYYSFCIRDDNSYKIVLVKNSKEDILIDWTYSEYIRYENNTLNIKKNNNSLFFSINNILLNKIIYKNISGNSIGFKLNKKIGIEIHKVKIAQS